MGSGVTSWYDAVTSSLAQLQADENAGEHAKRSSDKDADQSTQVAGLRAATRIRHASEIARNVANRYQ